jgi:hypothetical protein
VGLNFLGQGASEVQYALVDHMKDTSVYVRLEIAVLLYRLSRDAQSKILIEQAITGSNLYAAHHAIQQVVYYPDIAEDFSPAVREVRQRYTGTDRSGFNYPVQNSSEMFLYLYDDEPLYYEQNKPWLPELDPKN